MKACSELLLLVQNRQPVQSFPLHKDKQSKEKPWKLPPCSDGQNSCNIVWNLVLREPRLLVNWSFGGFFVAFWNGLFCFCWESSFTAFVTFQEKERSAIVRALNTRGSFRKFANLLFSLHGNILWATEKRGFRFSSEKRIRHCGCCGWSFEQTKVSEWKKAKQKASLFLRACCWSQWRKLRY